MLTEQERQLAAALMADPDIAAHFERAIIRTLNEERQTELGALVALALKEADEQAA